MTVIPTSLPGVLLLEPRVFPDARGFFLESYNRQAFAAAGITCEFVQDNHSRSCRHTLRGMHYQLPPRAQDKLVRVLAGEIYDVAVDLRPDSPTFGRWDDPAVGITWPVTTPILSDRDRAHPPFVRPSST